MGKQNYGVFLVVVTFSVLSQLVHGSGYLEVKFHSYRGDGGDSTGDCCDCPYPLHYYYCDPFFVICVDKYRGHSCSIHHSQTGYYANQNSIIFEDSMHGVANPIRIPMTSVPNQFSVRVKVIDDDDYPDQDDLIALLRTDVNNLTPTLYGNGITYRNIQMKNSEKAVLNIQVRSYCNQGWSGDHCDECTVCQNGGTCVDMNRGVKCKCSEGFEGSYCEKPKHGCVLKPCKNGGTCMIDNTAKGFFCACQSGWIGEICDVKMEARTTTAAAINTVTRMEVKMTKSPDDKSWASRNWYAIVLPILIALIVVTCIVAFIIVKKIKRKAPRNVTAFDNGLYHDTNRQRQSDVLDGCAVPRNSGGYSLAGEANQPGACDNHIYTTLRHYDEPYRREDCSCTGVRPYQNSNLVTLDPQCQGGVNAYTDFDSLTVNGTPSEMSDT